MKAKEPSETGATRSTGSAERIEGPTPAGGAYAIAYRHDDGAVEIVEFDLAGTELQRTYSPGPGDQRIADDILIRPDGERKAGLEKELDL
jgi:hypothetical protein